MAAGIANIEQLTNQPKGKSNLYHELEKKGAALEKGLSILAKRFRTPIQLQRIGSMFCAYFCNQPIFNLADAKKSDTKKFARFFHGMLDRGIYLAPSQFEAGFISTAHTQGDIEATLRAANEALKSL